MEVERLANVIEVALLASNQPVSVDTLAGLVAGEEPAPDRSEVRAALDHLEQRWSERGVELRQVATGYRFQVREDYGHWVARLAVERPGRYSRALLETLALIAYRQPITRGEIEDVRGVSVSSSIIKTLHEREWIRVVGHRELPGRPALYGTTRQFLDDFGLRRLEELPPLAEIRDFDQVGADLFSNLPSPVDGEDAADQDPAGEATDNVVALHGGEPGDLDEDGIPTNDGSPNEAGSRSEDGSEAILVETATGPVTDPDDERSDGADDALAEQSVEPRAEDDEASSRS